MSGDCVLDFFNEIKEEGYVGFLYIIFVIFYLIIFWQTLYVTMATDSYFETLDKEEEKEEKMTQEIQDQSQIEKLEELAMSFR